MLLGVADFEQARDTKHAKVATEGQCLAKLL